MTPEKITEHFSEAQRELELAWIDQNFPLFSTKASGYFGIVGRGAIIVDAATTPLSEGPLFTYFSKEQMEHITDGDIDDMVDDYNPEEEFVVLLLLPENQTRAYRIDIPAQEELLAGESSIVEYAGT
jgi:hypothetical protein